MLRISGSAKPLRFSKNSTGITAFLAYVSEEILNVVQYLYTGTRIHVKKMMNSTNRSINILLVEDNLINQKVACQFLTKWGMNVTVANHGKEALELLHRQRYNLILMDLQMPEMDGYEATRCIRSRGDDYARIVPIIAFTASSQADSREKAEMLGMNDYLTKPVNPEEMHNKITHYIMESFTEEDHRPLQLNFESYAEDAEFKVSLIALIIGNIRELQQAVYKAFYENEAQLYKGVCHKVKSSLVLLNDQEFSELAETLVHDFNTPGTSVAQEKIHHFNKLSESIIRSLTRETELLKASG
jgi:CheY-like chemotaxis protein